MGVASGKGRIYRLEIVLKVSERCNINCQYCYIYNKGNNLANESSAYITHKTLNGLTRFLTDAQASFQIDELYIVFHGGEPLMLKKQRFADICEKLLNIKKSGTKLIFAMQSNGTLIDPEWITLLSEYDFYVGISLDGTKRINDLQRVDKCGKSTYNKSVRGLKLLLDAYEKGILRKYPSVLSVINSASNGAETYRHFADELNLKDFDFLIPDDMHDDDHVDVDGVGKFLVDAFDEWVLRGKDNVFVRIFQSHMKRLVEGPGYSRKMHEGTPYLKEILPITVGSDGNIHVDDTLRGTNDPLFESMGNVSSSTLSAVLDTLQMREYTAYKTQLPKSCGGCLWSNVCSGGRLVTRFSKTDRFSNKTIFCNAERRFLSRASSYLLNAGFQEERLMSSLEER